MQLTKDMRSPPAFRRWAAICAIAGALERKIWISFANRRFYPNLFVMLCAPPGIGKSQAFDAAESLWTTLEDHHHISVNVTKAALVDELAAANRDSPEGTFNCLNIAVSELSAMIPGYDTDFLNTLTYLYDNKHYEEARRGRKDKIIIPNPTINLLACTTPGFLSDTLPPLAWTQGFLSRTIIVFSDLLLRTGLNFAEHDNIDEVTKAHLENDLKIIGARCGKMAFTQAAKEHLEWWYDEKEQESAPTHPRLQNYNTRRIDHLLKLCMIAAVDNDSSDITKEDVQTAIDWLKEAESSMEDIFKAMTSGGDFTVIGEIVHYVRTMNVRNETVPKAKVYQLLAQKLPSHSVSRAYENMKSSGMIREDPTGIIAIEAKAP